MKYVMNVLRDKCQVDHDIVKPKLVRTICSLMQKEVCVFYESSISYHITEMITYVKLFLFFTRVIIDC